MILKGILWKDYLMDISVTSVPARRKFLRLRRRVLDPESPGLESWGGASKSLKHESVNNGQNDKSNVCKGGQQHVRSARVATDGHPAKDNLFSAGSLDMSLKISKKLTYTFSIQFSIKKDNLWKNTMWVVDEPDYTIRVKGTVAADGLFQPNEGQSADIGKTTYCAIRLVPPSMQFI